MSPIWQVLVLYIGAPFTLCFRSHSPFVKYEILVQVWNIMYYIASVIHVLVRDVDYCVNLCPHMKDEPSPSI